MPLIILAAITILIGAVLTVLLPIYRTFPQRANIIGVALVVWSVPASFLLILILLNHYR